MKSPLFPVAVVLAVAVAFSAWTSCASDRASGPQPNSPGNGVANVTNGVDATRQDPGLLNDNRLAAQIVRDATTVETFRVRGRLTGDDVSRKRDPKYAAEFIGMWPIERRGPRLNRDFAKRLAAVLFDESNYVQFEPGNAKKCIFDPGVAFRFHSGQDTVDILVCFTCNQLSVASSRGQLRLPDGDIDPGIAKFAALAKEAFPKDPVIAALP